MRKRDQYEIGVPIKSQGERLNPEASVVRETDLKRRSN